MGSHHVDPADIDPAPDRPSTRRSISDACGLSQFAANVSEAAPDEDVPLASHSPDQQEEQFDVTAGELHVETPAEVVAVGAPTVEDVHSYAES